MVYALAREMKFQREMRALRRREKEGLREMAAQQARDARPAVPLSAPATIDGVAIGTEPAKAAGAQAETERSTVTHRLASRRDDPAPVTPENWQRLSDEQEKRRRARGYFTVEEAAQALGEQEGMHGGARQTLLARMMEAARDGNLTVRDPHTDLPFRPAEVHGYYELVTPADVNAWLERGGVEYRWSVPAVEYKPAPNESGAAGEPERRAFTHRLQGRRDDLTPAIDAAIARVSDPTDFAAVWGAFLALADSPEPMPPLLGVAEGEVKYRTAHRVKCITRDAFIKRLKYDANKRG